MHRCLEVARLVVLWLYLALVEARVGRPGVLDLEVPVRGAGLVDKPQPEQHIVYICAENRVKWKFHFQICTKTKRFEIF